MANFRTLGEEESRNIENLYRQFPEEIRTIIREAYNRTFALHENKGYKFAGEIAFEVAKRICNETYLIERVCKSCGGKMKEVKTSNATHQFCPNCTNKSLSYGEVKRIKEDSKDTQKQNVGDKENKEDKLVRLKDTTKTDNDDESGDNDKEDEKELQHKNVEKKHSEEDEMNEEVLQENEHNISTAIHKAKQFDYTPSGGGPKVSNIGTSFKLEHPEGHSLMIHSSPTGMGWSHKHSDNTMSHGSGVSSMTKRLNDLEEGYLGFNKLEKKIAKEKGVHDANAIAASIGRKKYGEEKFQKAASEHKPINKVK